MFDQIRVQVVHPCRARCAWCATHRKNPWFQELVDQGLDARVHDFYRAVVRRHRPREVFVSGGEPLLHPDIAALVRDLAEHAESVHVFTSYQFARGVVRAFGAADLHPDRVVLNHTPIYFEEESWHALTRGFPFATYLDNVRDAVALPLRKRFKFIVNHARLEAEIARFVELVRPDARCEVSLKLMNDQGGGLVDGVMRRSAERVNARLPDLDGVLAAAGWTLAPRPRTSIDALRPVIETGDVTLCPYRSEPRELRLALHAVKRGNPVLEYRYCPYFPADFAHHFHVGVDDIEKLAKNHRKGPFRERCGDCRLLTYAPGVGAAAPAAE